MSIGAAQRPQERRESIERFTPLDGHGQAMGGLCDNERADAVPYAGPVSTGRINRVPRPVALVSQLMVNGLANS